MTLIGAPCTTLAFGYDVPTHEGELDEEKDKEEEDEASRLLIKTTESATTNTKHVCKHYQCFERLFSKAKNFMTDFRKPMTPRHLEELIFLREN